MGTSISIFVQYRYPNRIKWNWMATCSVICTASHLVTYAQRRRHQVIEVQDGMEISTFHPAAPAYCGILINGVHFCSKA